MSWGAINLQSINFIERIYTYYDINPVNTIAEPNFMAVCRFKRKLLISSHCILHKNHLKKMNHLCCSLRYRSIFSLSAFSLLYFLLLGIIIYFLVLLAYLRRKIKLRRIYKYYENDHVSKIEFIALFTNVLCTFIIYICTVRAFLE